MQTIIFIIFWDFLMFYQSFLSPQVKWCAITERVAERLYTDDLSKLGNISKVSKLNSMTAWCRAPCQNQHFVNTSNKILRNRNETFSVARYFTWKLKLVSNILWMIVGFRYPRSDFKLSKTACNGCSLNFVKLQGTVNECSGVEKVFKTF